MPSSTPREPRRPPGARCPWCRLANGRVGRFPHIIDRGKPGVIGVLRDGRRFVNEADGYHQYVDAMIRATPEGEEVASWLICDHRYQRRMPFGMSRPFPLPRFPYLRNGYLRHGRTLEELSVACGIDPTQLRRTVDEFNAGAIRGIDPEFGRGRTAYNRRSGIVCPRPELRHSAPSRTPRSMPSRSTRLVRYVRRAARGCPRPRPRRCGRPDRGPLRGRHRPGERPGRALPVGWHQHRPRDDVRVCGGAPRGGRHGYEWTSAEVVDTHAKPQVAAGGRPRQRQVLR